MLIKTPIRTISHRHPGTQPRHARLADADMQASAIELMGACMSFAANAEIYGENEPADYLYKVVSGTVRTYKVLVGWAPSDRSLPPARRHFRLRDGGRTCIFGRSDNGLQDYRDQTECSHGACRKGHRCRPTNVGADRSRAATRPGAFAGAYQERGGAGRGISLGNGATTSQRWGSRASDVATGHRRLLGAHHRNRFAHAHAFGKRGGDRGAKAAPYPAA